MELCGFVRCILHTGGKKSDRNPDPMMIVGVHSLTLVFIVAHIHTANPIPPTLCRSSCCTVFARYGFLSNVVTCSLFLMPRSTAYSDSRATSQGCCRVDGYSFFALACCDKLLETTARAHAQLLARRQIKYVSTAAVMLVGNPYSTLLLAGASPPSRWPLTGVFHARNGAYWRLFRFVRLAVG